MRHLSFILLIICSALSSAAQGVFFYSEDEIGNSKITCITQDNIGYIWVGTEYGLKRFDGYRFHSYTHNPNDSTTLPHKHVTSLHITDDGQLLVGTCAGVAAYLPNNENFIRFHFPNEIEPRVDAITSHNGEIIIGTEGYGMYHLNYDDNTIERVEGTPSFVSRLCSHGKTLWLSDGEAVWAGNLRLNAEQGPPFAFLPDGKDLLLLSLHGASLLSNAKAIPLLNRPDLFFSCFTRTHDGRLIIGTVGNGLYETNFDMSAPIQSFKLPTQRYDISQDDIRAVYEDHACNLWIGCNNSGLLMVERGASPFRIFDANMGHSSMYPINIIATPGDTLFCQGKDNLLVFDMNAQLKGKLELPPGTQSIWRDRMGKLWMGTSNQLIKYDSSTEKWQEVLRLPGFMVNFITEDNSGHIFASTYGKGLAIYDQHTQQSRQISMYDSVAPGTPYLPNDWVSCMFVDKDDLLWIGTTQGIAHYDANHNRFEVLDPSFKLLSRYNVSSMAQLPDGTMAFGTNCGLYLSRSNGTLQAFEGDEELCLSAINGLVTDRDGDLWIASSSGLYRYDSHSGATASYQQASGVSLRVFSHYRTLALTNNGNIAFVNGERLIIFQPQLLKRMQQTLNGVHLTHISNAKLQADGSYKVDDGAQMVRMDFSALDFVNARSISYECKVDGSATIHNALGENRIDFNLLRPGTLTLEVRSRLGTTISEPAYFTLHVPYPWYLRWYMILGYFVLAFLFGWYVYYNYRHRKRAAEEHNELTNNINGLQRALHKIHKKSADATTADHSQIDTVPASSEIFLARVKESITRHFNDSAFTTDQLAKEVGVSRAQLNRKFKDLLGTSPSLYLRTQRLERAQELLLERKLSISDVAYSTGFASEVNFSIAFKRHFGQAPRHFLGERQGEDLLETQN